MPDPSSVVDVERWLETDASDLPALSIVATQVLQMDDRLDADRDRLAEVVVRDPVLAARVLRLVNSAYFGLSQRITDVRHAILLLGFRTVRTVVLMASVLSAFKDVRNTRFDLDRFWRHSVSNAAVCRTLARRGKAFDAETAFSAGLLHDIGKLLLVAYRPAEADRVIEFAQAHSASFYRSERETIPVTHPELGAWLAERWDLPEVLVKSLANHHAEAAEALDPLGASIQFANYLCVIKGLTTSGSHGPAELSRAVWPGLGLTAADVPPLIDVINAEIKTADSLLHHSS